MTIKPGSIKEICQRSKLINLVALNHAVTTQTGVTCKIFFKQNLKLNYTFAPSPFSFKSEAPDSRVDWYGFKFALRKTSVKRWNFQSISERELKYCTYERVTNWESDTQN